MISVLRIPALSAGDRRTLLVMLPGLNMAAEDFVTQGFVAAAQERNRLLDVVALKVGASDYLDGTFIGPLHDTILAPARAEGYARIVLLGVSLGAMGAVLYARAHPGDLDGLVLLAPFLGTPGTIVAVERAGGLARWEPGTIGPNELEHGLLAWLKAYCALQAPKPWIVLGYGTEDRFRDGARLLAAALPPDHVVARTGLHEAPTWLALWRIILDQEPVKGSGDGT